MAKNDLPEDLGQYNSDLSHVMSTEQGRRFIGSLIASTGLFMANHTTGNESFIIEGKRSVGCELLSDINAVCPELWIKLMDEQIQREKVKNND